MSCINCKNPLSPLECLLSAKCDGCLLINSVHTDEQHQVPSEDQVHYDANPRAVMGELCEEPTFQSDVNMNAQPIIVYFDLETSGFPLNADILQIGAVTGSHEFSIYITPTEEIDERASQANGLRLIDGSLHLHNQRLETVPLESAMHEFYKFLYSLNSKSLLVAHNYKFDRPKLINAIETTSTKTHFKSIVYGFADTLPSIKRINRGESKFCENNKLEDLAPALGINNNNAHNALIDVKMLQEVMMILKIDNSELINSSMSWDSAVEDFDFAKKLPELLSDLGSLGKCTSRETRVKMAKANISLKMIRIAYNNSKLQGLLDLLGADETGIVKVSKSKALVQRIYDFLDKDEPSPST